MGRTINSSKLTKEYIFTHVSQELIFSKYFNLSVNIINHCIETGDLILSPIREDKHPTCGFKYDNRGKLKFRDFAGFFWGDCFDAAALIINHIYNLKLDVSNKKDFIQVLRHITITFKDIFQQKEQDPNLNENIKKALANIKKEKPLIDLVTRQWNKKDVEYWSQFGINIQFLNVNFVYPIDQYYINIKINPEPKYYYNEEDPCYAYYLGKDKNGINNIKLYFPKRTKSQNRFITNCNHLEGILSLNSENYDFIVITKSTKDRLSIANTIMNMKSSLYGQSNIKIGVINIPHETYNLRQFEFDWLVSKLKDNGVIVSLMDNDRTGKLEAIKLYKIYSIIPIIIPKETSCKDFAEFYFKFGKNHVYKTINDIINKLSNNADTKYIWEKEKSHALPY